MEENPKSPDGQAGRGSEPTNDTNSSLTELQKKLEYLQSESKEAFKVRDELKAKLKAFEEAEEMKKGNYEKLLADKNTEFEQLRAEAEELKQTKEKFDSFQKAMKEELLNELPEGHRVIAGELSLDKLREYVKLNKSSAPAMDTSRVGGSGTIDIAGKKWFDFTSSELNELKKSSPKIYEQLRKTI